MATPATDPDTPPDYEHLKHECSRLHSEIVHLQVHDERLKAEVLRLEAENDSLRAENCRLQCQRASILAILSCGGPTETA